MFSSGGAEANETNFKLIRLYWALQGQDRRTTIVARHHGYQPLGASVIADHVWDTIVERLPAHVPVSHGFTYSGHPAACAAALANLAIIEDEGLVANAADVGAYLHEQLHERLGDHESVGEIRGVGLMAGIELVADRDTNRGFSIPHSACTMVELEAWERGLSCRARRPPPSGPPPTTT